MATTKRMAALVATPSPKLPKVGDVGEVEIAKLEVPFYVRQKLDQDWVLQLAEQIENGVELRPIKIVITPEGKPQVRDGRHRMKAHELCDRTKIKAEVVAPAKNIAEEISLAYNENAGGALPPGRDDITHTISLLLSHGLKPPTIAHLIPTFPPSLVRKYVQQIYDRERSARLREAVGAVSDGELNVPQAAEKYGVQAEALRKLLGGKKKQSVARAAEMVAALKRRIVTFSQQTAAVMKKQIEGFEDGEVTAHQLDVVTDALVGGTKRIWTNAQGWRGRIEEAKAKRARIANVEPE